MQTSNRKISALSLKDLLDAREAYHVHLINKPNVFATAVGRYLIRKQDPDAKDAHKEADRAPVARTLRNSIVQPWSWPCIHVLVDRWLTPQELALQQPDDGVPRYLYLPDGRIVPTCVVYAPPGGAVLSPDSALTFPGELVGGGYPLYADVQGRRHVASIGCLVTDGDQVYALTNRHVTGPSGREVHTLIRDAPQRIGVSAGRDLGKLPFPEVYSGWPGARVRLNMDAGLLRVDNVNRWTAQVYGMGMLGPMVDLSTESLDLDLIDKPVCAFGGTSGLMQGRIAALFYRYRARAGLEYVCDFLIGPRSGDAALGVRRGDSGTVWFVDEPVNPIGEVRGSGTARQRSEAVRVSERRPLALQWGGTLLGDDDGGAGQDFALATALSTVCRELDVEPIIDWNTGQPETWGSVGHFKVGRFACGVVKATKLRAMMQLNADLIGLDDDSLVAGVPSYPAGTFVPLADVADYVWRVTRKLDASNHFADMDEEGQGDFAGSTLLSLCEDVDNVDPGVWNAFYAGIGASKRGALPFRVWQMFDALVAYAAADDWKRFVCTAGLMAHYVGDACQPLHVSKLHHGLGDAGGERVHATYETDMLESHASEILPMIKAAVGTLDYPTIGKNGRQAAVAVIALMRRTVKRLPPLQIVQAFDDNPGRGRQAALWSAFGERTAVCLADGSVTLAALWEAAWKAGSKETQFVVPDKAFTKKQMMALYNDKAFLPAIKLQDWRRDGDALVKSDH
ncbi:MAG: hypothetical protein ABI411_15865 [Tahibacter sp.]